MTDAIEKLRQRATSCRLLAQTALTENGREALSSMAEDYDRRAQQLVLKPSATFLEQPRATSLAD